MLERDPEPGAGGRAHDVRAPVCRPSARALEPVLARLRRPRRARPSVARHVELEPARDAGRRDLRRGRGRDRREAHDRPGRRAARAMATSPSGCATPLERDRRDEDRHGDLLPEHRGRGRGVGDVDEHARAQLPAAVGLDVVARASPRRRRRPRSSRTRPASSRSAARRS